MPINESLLQQRGASSLPIALPPPSYLKYGAISFDQAEISTSSALIAIEHDSGFCRIDELESLDQVRERIASGHGLHNSFQLTDSFMRNVAFKMDKMDKFGA